MAGLCRGLEDLNTVFGQIEEMEDLANVYGQTLDYFGVNYGVNRNGLSDNAYRALIFARRANTIGGNSVDRILEFLSFYVDMSRLSLVELWDVSANFFLDGTQNLDGTWELSSVAIGLFLDGSWISMDRGSCPESRSQPTAGFMFKLTGITSEERAIPDVRPPIPQGWRHLWSYRKLASRSTSGVSGSAS